MSKANFKVLFMFLSIVSISSCSQHEISKNTMNSVIICELQENLRHFSEPLSFSILDNGCFVICDGRNVILYSDGGKQLRMIGHRGKALYEYNNPSIVRTLKDTIYVWSSASLKFISFDLDGNPIQEYPYNSAVADFVLSDDNIIIYNAGRQSDKVIDIYDKVNRVVVDRLLDTSPEHRLLLHSWAVAPISNMGTSVVFSPKDKISLYQFDFRTEICSELFNFASDSFTVIRDVDYDEIINNRKKRSAYLRENSQVLSVFQDNQKYYLLCLEGSTEIIEDKYDTSSRFFSVYCVGNKSPLVGHYYYDSIGTQLLFSSSPSGLYFLKHNLTDSDESYILERVNLP